MNDFELLKNINNIDDDLIFEAESFKSRKAKNPIRLKVALIAAAATLVVGLGGVTAVMMNRANVATADEPGMDEYPRDVEVTSGKYYLNGDKDSGLWVEVNPDFLTLKGDDIETALKDAAGGVEVNYNNMKLLYCAEKDYVVRNFNPDRSEYVLNISRSSERLDDESLRNERGVAGLMYNKAENTIHLGAFGDFTLVE